MNLRFIKNVRSTARAAQVIALIRRTLRVSKRELSGASIAMGLAAALVLDAGGQTDHKLSSRLESVDFEGAVKLADS
jgi:hypothetical protein